MLLLMTLEITSIEIRMPNDYGVHLSKIKITCACEVASPQHLKNSYDHINEYGGQS